ncbi:MAG: hypothetical protein K2M95_05750, partial [Clostridiales bacterium]|nr:hypothetical protein [Clostridiales bacterium]
SGTFEISAAKELTEFKFDNFAESQKPLQTFLGPTLPASGEVMSELETVAQEAIMEQMYKKLIGIHDGYITMVGEGCTCLYKTGAQKLTHGTVISVYTPKDLNDFNGVFGESAVTYESDYYITKLPTEVDLTDDAQKAEVLSDIDLFAFVADEYGNGQGTMLPVTDITAIQLATLGTRNTTITYNNGTADVTKDVTYTVVASDEDLPEEAIVRLSLNYKNKDIVSVIGIAKGTQLYEDSDFTLFYYKAEEPHQGRGIVVNAANASGANAVITISGYDPNTTGLQTVTFTYKGQSVELLVFVYDETVNPIVKVEDSGVVTITKAGDTYTADYTNAKATAYKFGDNTGTEITFTEADAINLRDLSTYEDEDEIVFKYQVQFGGHTYTFYVALEVEVVEATPAE